MEAAGLATVSLTTIPDLTAATSAPRVVGIERPAGMNVGAPGDVAGQRAALLGALTALEQISTPGTVVHLPLPWVAPEPPIATHPAENPPIVRHIVRHPWQLPRLLRRT
jgi:hypothetical protein